ncbi:MAG: CRP-like cAMP-binding protein [Myxococcota bacterium]|jgi:CRP-like cAMP-binding protein
MELVSSVVRPHLLTEEDRASFIDELYAAHCDVFDGVTRESFTKYVIDSTADRTEIKVFRTEAGELAGYIAAHFFEREFAGELCTVMRLEAGMKRAFRGANVVGPFVVQQVIQSALTQSRELWYLGSLVHPSSYCALTRHAQEFWPNPDVPTPPDTLEFMLQLADDFGLERVDPERPLVRSVGWITRDTPAERAFWLGSKRPLARFFCAQNPNFFDGHGLVTLIPMGRERVVANVTRWGSRAVSRRLAAVGRSFRRISGSDRLTHEEVLQELSASEYLEGVSEDAIRLLLTSSKQQELRAGEVLFREGERGDSMYIVVQGSMYVLRDSGIGTDVVIDQTDVGDCFGELSLVSGAPRSATLRAATDATLIRIDGKALWQLGPEHSAVERLVWHNVGRFRFFNLMTTSQRFAAATSDEHSEWWMDADRRVVQSDPITVAEPGWLFVYEGAAELDEMLISGPSLLPITAGTHIHGAPLARIALFPAAFGSADTT